MRVPITVIYFPVSLPARVRYYTDPACSASWASSRHAPPPDGVRRRGPDHLRDGRSCREYEGDQSRLIIEWLNAAGASACRSTRGSGTRGPIALHLPGLHGGQGGGGAGAEAERALSACAARGHHVPPPQARRRRAAGRGGRRGGPRRGALPHRPRVERDRRGLRGGPRGGASAASSPCRRSAVRRRGSARSGSRPARRLRGLARRAALAAGARPAAGVVRTSSRRSRASARWPTVEVEAVCDLAGPRARPSCGGWRRNGACGRCACSPASCGSRREPASGATEASDELPGPCSSTTPAASVALPITALPGVVAREQLDGASSVPGRDDAEAAAHVEDLVELGRRSTAPRSATSSKTSGTGSGGRCGSPPRPRAGAG